MIRKQSFNPILIGGVVEEEELECSGCLSVKKFVTDKKMFKKQV